MSLGNGVAVVVPNHNGGPLLLEALRAVTASLPEAEVWLIDDGSTDGSLASVRSTFPAIHTLGLGQPHGAACARNQGLRVAHGDYLFCVDADVVCQPGCLPALVGALTTADIVFPMLLAPDGQLLSPGSESARHWCLNSAVFGIRRAALGRMDSLFDETIQVYGEDNDFFLRAARLGLAIRYVPAAQAIHPWRRLLGERHYYLTVRNAVYVWLKLRGLIPYWLPMDLWLVLFLSSQLVGALVNRSLGPRSGRPLRLTDGSRLRLLRLFFEALAWNARHWQVTRAARRAFEAFLVHAHSPVQLA